MPILAGKLLTIIASPEKPWSVYARGRAYLLPDRHVARNPQRFQLLRRTVVLGFHIAFSNIF